MNIMFWAIAACMILLASVFLPNSLIGVSSVARNRYVQFLLMPTLLSAALAAGIYAYFGNREAAVADRPLSASTQSSARTVTAARRKLESVASLVDGLAARVRREPNDAGSWLLLAKSYRHLGRPDEAATAYSRAVLLGKSDADMETFVAGYSSDGTKTVGTHGWENVAVEFAERIDEEI